MSDPVIALHRWHDLTYEITCGAVGVYNVQVVPNGPYVAAVYVVDQDDGTSGDYLTSVIVEPEHRRRGIGLALYAAIEKDLGYALRPSPRHVSHNAQKLWAKRGHGRFGS